MQHKYFNRQVKAARTLLAWKQQDLANNSGVSIGTIRKLEQMLSIEEATFNERTLKDLRNTLEKHGVQFITIADCEYGIGVTLT